MRSPDPDSFDRRESILGRLMDRTEINEQSGCWVWTGPDSGTGRGGGYGRMSLNGQTVAVHLVAFTHYHGYIPGNRQVDHECNNRRCWNPDHLKLVTHLRNQRLRAKRQKVKKAGTN